MCREFLGFAAKQSQAKVTNELIPIEFLSAN